jgi:hypothetical protein
MIDGAPQIDHLAVQLQYISSRCHRQWRNPRIREMRRRRMSAANIGPTRGK